jgi:hypothetical protein
MAEQKAEKEKEKITQSPSEWFEWFVTTEEYKEDIKEINNPDPNSSKKVIN